MPIDDTADQPERLRGCAVDDLAEEVELARVAVPTSRVKVREPLKSPE